MPRSPSPSRGRSRSLSTRSRSRSPYSNRSPSPLPKVSLSCYYHRRTGADYIFGNFRDRGHRIWSGFLLPKADTLLWLTLMPVSSQQEMSSRFTAGKSWFCQSKILRADCHRRQTSTPSELIKLLYPSFPAPYRSPQTRFHFRHVYVDANPRGLYRFKDLTSFIGRDLQSSNIDDSMDPDENRELSKRGRKIEEKPLDDYGFVTGDFLSVSITVPEPRHPVGSLAAGALAGIAGNSSAGPAGLRDREGPRGGFGWGDRGGDRERLQRSIAPTSAPGEGPDATRWGRGAPLPPQGRIGSRGGRGGYERAPLPEGRWNRDDDRNGPTGLARDRSRSPRRDRRESGGKRRD